MTAEPEPKPNVVIRAARADDAHAIRLVLIESFPSADEADLVEEIRAGETGHVEFVSEVEGLLISTCLISEGRIDMHPVWCLGPVATAPAAQRCGIGSQLIEATCEAALRRGVRAVFVLGDPAFYRRFGFTPAVPLGWSTQFLTPGVPVDAFQVKVCAEVDTPTGNVDYHHAFDRFV